MDECISFDDPQRAAALIMQRAKLMQTACVTAGHNLLIAQHRDTLRYAKLRSGGYLPRLSHFFVGQYVYVRHQSETIHTMARQEILRVREVRPAGVLILEGADGATISENALNCAPCHLPILTSPLIAVPRPSKNLSCEACGFPDREHLLLLCDICQKGWHSTCISPDFHLPPAGVPWYCPGCHDAATVAASPSSPLSSLQVSIDPLIQSSARSLEPTTDIDRRSPAFYTRPGQKLIKLRSRLLR
jgi:hypothetical protein